MNKVFHIAFMEYRQFVATKTFIVSIVLMPLLIGGMGIVQILGGSAQDLEDKRFAIYDQTGVLAERIIEAAKKHNRYDLFLKEAGLPRKQIEPRFLPEEFTHEGESLERIEQWLSGMVRSGEIFAFVIIEADVVEAAYDKEERVHEDAGNEVRYYSNRPAHQPLPNWLSREVQRAIKEVRFEAKGIDAAQVKTLSKRVSFERFGLAEINEAGEALAPEEDNEVLVLALPMAVVLMLFMCANMSTPLMLNSVIEEKMNKIAEVLVSSVTPFQLIWGKLLGTVGVGLTLSGIYLSGTFILLLVTGVVESIPLQVFFWFFVFLFFTLLCFGALWAGIGAVCSQIKDTQNFTGVAALFIVAPMVLAPAVLMAPDGQFVRIVSLLPPFTPFIMMMRIAIPPGVPLWEILLGLGTTALFTLGVVWMGARLFRIGLLWQGQTPDLLELVRWLWRR